MPTTVFQRRLSRCRTAMHAHGLDTLIVTPGAGMRYLTGFSEPAFERLLCLIVPDDRPLCFITPALNADQARANPAGIDDIRAWTDTEGWERVLREIADDLDLNIGIVGVDEYMPARFLLKLQEILPTTLVKSAAPVFVDLRSVKDDAELDAMQRAASLTDHAYHAALAACEPGVTEAQLARVVRDAVIDGGGELAFETLIATGPNSALPHHAPGARQAREGEVVLFDLGAKIDGYCGDITRVASVGAPEPKAAQIYDIVLRAHRNAVSAAGPGTPASFVDRVAREVIAEAGYGDFFFHRTGHGIGLDDHEAPNIVHGNDAKLETGNCFSVEPGIYLAGSFGVRLENIVTVTSDGVRALNEAIPPRLMSIEELRAL